VTRPEAAGRGQTSVELARHGVSVDAGNVAVVLKLDDLPASRSCAASM